MSNATEFRANSHASTPIPARPWLAASSLCWREYVRFFRQRNRVIAALGQPILFWLLFGTGMGRMFQVEGQSFTEYYFPGTLMLILMFTAIFATFSIIEDRREGFLQSVLVAPAPRWSMVLGKVVGGALIAVIQGGLFLLLSATVGIKPSVFSLLAVVGWMFLVALALNAFGFLLAWRMESTQGFHAIMNLLLMPMWLLSGAFFPVLARSSDTGWGELIMQWLMRLNPMSYAVAGLRRLLYSNGGDLPLASDHAIWLPALSTCVIVMGVFSTVVFVLACWVSRQSTKGDLL